MSERNGNPYIFRLGTTGPAETELLDIVSRAISAGVGPTVIQAMREVRERLRINPREFGEPMYRLRAMRMLMRHAIVNPLYIEFGVHDDEPVVVIRRVRWLADPAGG